ncbi:MAG: ankyrin repeat domain-containing protein [Wolbachia sp.]
MCKHTDINAKDNMERTALHYAACFKNTDIVELLLEAEAKTNIKDNNGKKPLSFAKNKEIIDLLRGLLAKSLSNVMVSCLLTFLPAFCEE